MCSPGAVTATVAVVSTIYSAKSQREQAKYEAGVANYKARVAENDAQRARNEGVEEENIKRQATAELLSKQRAQLGAANVQLTTGSALQLQEETVMLGEADALRIRSNFEEKAKALESFAELTRRDVPGMGDPLGKVKQYGSALFPGTLGVIEGAEVSKKWYTEESSALQ